MFGFRLLRLPRRCLLHATFCCGLAAPVLVFRPLLPAAAAQGKGRSGAATCTTMLLQRVPDQQYNSVRFQAVHRKHHAYALCMILLRTPSGRCVLTHSAPAFSHHRRKAASKASSDTPGWYTPPGNPRAELPLNDDAFLAASYCALLLVSRNTCSVRADRLAFMHAGE